LFSFVCSFVSYLLIFFLDNEKWFQPYYKLIKWTETKPTQSDQLNIKKLISNSVTKFSTMTDEKLQGHHLKFIVSTMDQCFDVVILF
jgi:hypothetical protein